MIPFTLSPLSDVEIKEARTNLRCAEYVVTKHAKEAAARHLLGLICVDFLALDHPSVKKTVQKREQRAKDQLSGIVRTPKPIDRRSARKVCKLRAKAWLKLAPFVQGVDILTNGPNRPWRNVPVLQDVGTKKSGFGHNGGGGTVTIYRETLVPLNTCDGKDRVWRGHREHKAKQDSQVKQKSLALPDGVDLSVSNLSLTTPVPEPVNIVLGRENVLRSHGTEVRVKTNFCPECGDYVTNNHEHQV